MLLVLTESVLIKFRFCFSTQNVLSWDELSEAVTPQWNVFFFF